MSESTDMAVQRELGAISSHLSAIDTKLGEIREQTTTTNGRVGVLEGDVAVLKDREGRYLGLNRRVEDIERRGRTYALAIGGPVLAAGLALVFQHGIP